MRQQAIPTTRIRSTKLAAVGCSVACALALAGCAGAQVDGQAGSAESSLEANAASSSSAVQGAAGQTEESAAATQDGGGQIAVTDMRTDSQIVDAVVGHFEQLAAIPRQPGGEGQVSDYLKGWAEDAGFEVAQDEAGNIVFDVPATPGLESAPLVGLQAHMDMVCTAKEGTDYDPAADPIQVLRDDAADALTANGTSLGATGGMGVATIMDIAEGNMDHGPLRVLFTADGEGGFTGARSLAQESIADLPYLINVSGGASDAVAVGSAGEASVTAAGSLELLPPSGNAAATITIDGLSGGHSGLRINRQQCNAARAMVGFLRALSAEKIPYELAQLHSGTSESAIPSSATATIVFSSGDAGGIRDHVTAYERELKGEFGDTETGISVRMGGADVPEWVISNTDAGRALDYAANLFDGVYAMSQNVNGSVETSSNLGVLSIDNAEGFWAVSLARSLERAKLEDLVQQQLALASGYGFDAAASEASAIWLCNPDSTIVPLCESVYRHNNGKSIRLEAVHMTTERGVFSERVPELDILSIGPDVTNANTPDETVKLSSIPKTWHLIEGILSQL